MGRDVLETLFYPFEKGILDKKYYSNIAFLNARYYPALDSLENTHLFLQQYFRPYASELQDQGYAVSSEIRAKENFYDAVLVNIPKNITEAAYLIAQALGLLREGGVLLCAAENKAGGARLKKLLTGFGLKNIQEYSKNKCRAVWAEKENIIPEKIQESFKTGEMQPVLEGEYYSQPGIFGWDKIDKGSEILLRHIPHNLKGSGADFGCGYGYLSSAILRYGQVENLFCIDADFRALSACRKNLEKQNVQTKIKYLWEDLTRPNSNLRDLDWIVMNPPFHEGKKADIGIGISFIETAWKSLKPGGKLWMVANAMLAYENILNERFSSCKKKYEGEGFKIFAAVK